MEHKTRTAILITAYNEEANIGGVLSSVENGYDVFVMDDGSSDRTRAIAEGKGARVISHALNLGQGCAFITGMNLLLKKDYAFIVHLDGDGQHNPREVGKLIRKMQDTGADIVAGSRLLGSNYRGAPVARNIFLPPLTWLLNRLTGYEISDSMCGFRAFRCGTLRTASDFLNDMTESEYVASEMWIKFAKAGLKAENVPITLAGRKSGFSYKGLFRYGFGVFTTIVRAKLDIYRHHSKGGSGNMPIEERSRG